jgi:hypothetical protein
MPVQLTHALSCGRKVPCDNYSQNSSERAKPEKHHLHKAGHLPWLMGSLISTSLQCDQKGKGEREWGEDWRLQRSLISGKELGVSSEGGEG